MLFKKLSMFSKKSMAISIGVVFSCAAMQQDSQPGAQSLPPDLQASSSNRQHSSANDLAQRVAALKCLVVKATNGNASKDDFSATCEHIRVLQSGLYPCEGNVLVKGTSPRVLKAMDCVFEYAGAAIVDGQQLFNQLSEPSPLPLDEEKTILVANFFKFKKFMHLFFESIDRNGTAYGNAPRVASKHKVVLDPSGSLLAGIEALECFAQASDDNERLCGFCKNRPKKLWCSDCQGSADEHSRITPSVRSLAQETKENVGVQDALWYLESRIGATSVAIDSYIDASNGNVPFVLQKEVDRARAYVETRKAILQIAAVHKDIVEDIATMSDEDLSLDSVWPLLENAPSSIGLAAGAVKNKKSWNPLVFVPAQLFCSAVLGDKSTKKLDATVLPKGVTLDVIAKMVQDGVKTTLGISYKEMPLFCQLTHVLSGPINGLIKEGVLCVRDSAVDVERFAAVYKKPMREQFLSQACSEQLALMAHAWKIGNVENPHAMPGTSASVPVAEDNLDEEK
jgi:hypothetical protein